MTPGRPNGNGRLGGLAGAILRAAGRLVPRDRRDEWLREWEAELGAWREAGRGTTGSALGAFPHATVLFMEGWTMTIERWARDLRVAARTLLRRPLFTLSVAATLAIGIGATLAVFTVVEAVLLRPLAYPDGDRILALGEANDDGSLGTTSFANAWDWRERSHSFAAMAMLRTSGATLTGEGDPEQLAGVRVSWSYFDVLGVHPELGRDFTADEDHADAERVILLSHGLWARRFGSDPTILGRPITLTGTDYTVVGVMPAGFEDLAAGLYYETPDYWMPLRYELDGPSSCRTCRHLRVVGRLASGVTLEGARTELAGIARALVAEHPQDYAKASAVLDPLHDQVTGPVRGALWVLLGAVSFVLLIACANVASLLLSRAIDQRREVALRSALGASRTDLVGRTVVECLLLALAGGGVGMLLGTLAAHVLVAFAPPSVQGIAQVRLDGVVVAFALAVTLLTALLFGLAPVLQGSRANPAAALKEGGRSSAGRGHHRTRGFLVVADVAVAIVLLTGVGLTLRSFVGVLSVDPGFDPSNTIEMNVSAVGPQYGPNEAVRAFFGNVLARVRAVPGVRSVGLATQVPLGGNFDRVGVEIEGRPEPNPSLAPDAERYAIDGDYLATMRIPVMKGRGLTEADREDAPFVVLVNETFADRLFPDGDAIGRRIRFGADDDPWRAIVGVVGDVRHYALEEPAEPQLYVPEAQWTSSYMVLVARTQRDPAQTLDGIRHAVWSVDRDIPVSGIATFDDLISRATAQRRFVLGLLSAFAGAALLLTMVGIYGLLSFHVAQRTREIGIRVALGAGGTDVLRMVVGEGMTLTLMGVGAGLAGALGLTRFLAGMLFGVHPIDPLTLAAVSALMLGVSLVACGLPARRATRVHAPAALSAD